VLLRLQKWVRRRVIHGRPDSAEILRHYSQSITNILDMNRLASAAVSAASQTLDVRQGFLFLVDQDQAAGDNDRIHLGGVKVMGNDTPADGSLSTGSPLTGWFRTSGKPLTQVEIDTQPRFHSLPQDECRWLEELGAEVYLPIYAKNEWIGLLTLGPKGSGAEYTAHDLALLSTLADQTAVALENLRLVEGLMRLNNDFRRAYSALDQANQHLERLDRTKSDFISIASHELRTPLTLINGASQMLLDDPDLGQNTYHQQLLQKIKTGGDRLHEILETMLDVAKIDLRTLDLEPQPVSMGNLILGVCADLKKDSAGRKQIIDVDIPQDLPVVMADMLALRKVFYHLISNAVKYTPDEGRITITGRRLEPNVSDLPQGGVEIVVADTGIGIDPRFQELIFVKFYQTGELALHSTGKTKFKGSGPGLGLAIARGIVEAHHGRIWVESPGYDEQNCPGSQFHVILPTRAGDRPLPPSPMIFTSHTP
jgi:signal transduction histidine kinase